MFTHKKSVSVKEERPWRVLPVVRDVQECDATEADSSNSAGYIKNAELIERGKLRVSFQRLLVLLWPNNKQIRL
jgi:hypothetical protein